MEEGFAEEESTLYSKAEEVAVTALENLRQIFEEQTLKIQELSYKQIEAWQNLANNSVQAFNDVISVLSNDIQSKILQITGIINNDISMQNASANAAIRITSRYNENLGIAVKTQEEIMNTASIINADALVEEAIIALAENATRVFDEKTDGVMWGNDLIDEICSSMTSSNNINKVKSAAAKVAAAIQSQLGFSLPDEGPLSDADEYMPDMIKLFANGIKDNKSQLINEVDNMTQEMSDTLKQTPTTLALGNRNYNRRTSNNHLELNIYCQKLDEKEMDNIFKYVNRRLGTEY